MGHMNERSQEWLKPLEPIVHGDKQCNRLPGIHAPRTSLPGAAGGAIRGKEAIRVDGAVQDAHLRPGKAVALFEMSADKLTDGQDEGTATGSILPGLQPVVRLMSDVEESSQPGHDPGKAVPVLAHIVLDAGPMQSALGIEHISSQNLVEPERQVVVISF